ncbi:MAG: MFS transporter, partial [Chitinophagales bacterium]|nr:MFS transporter [Hyphomicrobiales bacterium]
MPQFSPGAASRAVNARRAERQPAIALLTEVAALGQFAGNICGPSLHSVARDFGVTAGGAQLTIAIFFAAFAIAQLLLGPVSERHGRRPVMLTGIVLFLVGTAVCAAALSLDLLLLGRIVQAAGAAGAIVMSRAITRDCFDGPALTRTLATITIVFALVPGLTPLLGGALEHMAGWRASFVAVGLTGAVVLAAVITRLDETLKIRLLGSICVTGDHSRPETVWEAIKAFPDAGPHRIRRMLTEGAVRHDDRRARFIGSEDYEAAGGAILRDLFEDEGTGWFEDAGLLDRLVTEKLSQATDEVRAEGWKWVAYAPDFGHGASYRFRHVPGLSVALTPDEETEPQALIAEYENIQDTYANCDVIPDDEAERLDSLEAALATFKNRPVAFDAAEMAIAGARISLNRDGTLRIERGFVRPKDEPQAANGRDEQSRETAVNAALYAAARVYYEDSDEEAQAVSTKLPDRLVANLTAQQTLVLRERLAANPEIA